MGLIVVSNREPYSPVRSDGGLRWVPAVGGLTAALDPAMRARGGTWIAWGDGERKVREVELPQGEGKYRLERLPLTPSEISDYYQGFSNRALWPMSHYSLGRVRYQSGQWRAYQKVNRRFAEAVVRAYRPGDTVWVHDYHLALVPAMVREAIPEATIGFFWHIPWPSSELFRTLPWDREVLEGILGADLVGLHTEDYVRHFASCCRAVLGLQGGREALRYGGREVRVEAHPIGVDYPALRALAESPAVREQAREVRLRLGVPMVLGVDRLDYTKGIPERLEAFAHYLDNHPEAHGRVTFVQIAVPSREAVESYRHLRERVDGLVGRINSLHGRPGWTPVQYVAQGYPLEELAAYYLAADVMLVTPLRDGLNLVAKEFAAVSEDGVLMLSEFAGAAEEMPDALLVNPFDTEGMAAALHTALQMPPAERLQRLSRLQTNLRRRDLRGWVDGFLGRLERAVVEV